MTLLPILAALLMSPQAAPAGRANATPLADRPAPPATLAKVPDALPKSRVRAPVLREGTYLAGVQGFFASSVAEPGLLVFKLDEGLAANVRRTLFVMPCDPSDDVKAILSDVTVDTPALFEVSGRVHDYRGRAYLLPVSVVALKNPPPPDLINRTPPKELLGPAPVAKTRPAPRLDAYLDESTPTMELPTREAPRPRMAHEPDPAMFPALDDGMADDIERRLEAGIQRSKTATALRPAIQDGDRTKLLPAATRLQSRRATVLRDPVTGAWRARLDAARTGRGVEDGAEVTMEILPSKALESLERRVREQPVGTAWLLSGEVVVSKDRGFLLLERAAPVAPNRFLTP
jgi:hypothetical protein